MRAAVRKLRVEDVEKLQALVVEHFDAIEPGLTVLDARLLLGHATIDVIGVDAVGALVLGAVGFSANEEMLLKAVEAYSWCLEYPEALVRLYPSCQVSDDRPPRLLFVVERMPDAFHRKIKQLGFPEVDCIEFRHLEFDGIPTVYFESLLRLRRQTGRVIESEPLTAPASGGSGTGENVITMNGAGARVTAAKHPKVLTPAGADSATNIRSAERVPSRETSPVVSMVSRQAVVAAPRIERPRPASEPVVLREPEPLLSEPAITLESDPIVDALGEMVAEPELSPVVNDVPHPVVEPAEPPAPAARPLIDVVPSMAPAHVVTATAPAPERVSFKDLATKLLETTIETPKASSEAVASVVTPVSEAPLSLEEPVVPSQAPIELVLESAAAAPVEQPKPAVTTEAALEEILALAAKTLPAPPSKAQVEAPVSAAPAPAVQEQAVAEPAKPAAPPLPQGFEGLKFPNDGVLTRQWMEFLSQMSATK